MSDSGETFGLEDNRLGLIDVSFEDDCLYSTSSPPRDFQFSDDLLNNGNAPSLELPDPQSLETSGDGVDDRGHASQPVESPEPEESKQNVKYNLRKSLAWDSAFFTSAGVLEPDELSSMIGQTEKRKMLPEIREELERSTDSLSTLASDGLTMENLEDDLLGDVRASIQKSSRCSTVADSMVKAAAKKAEEASSDKPKAKAAPLKKADAVIPGARRMLKPASSQVPPQACAFTLLRFLRAKGESAPLPKPPQISGRVSISTAAKRASLSNNRVKVEKEMGKASASNSANKDLTGSTVAGRLKIPTPGGLRSTVSKLPPPLRSSSSSTKTESIASSFDCSESISSDGSSKSSVQSVRQKVLKGAGSVPSSTLIAKAALRIGSKGKNHSTIPNRSPHLKSVAKLSPNISPASSVSEWSSESLCLSPTSTLNKESNCSRSSIDTASCRDIYEEDTSSQVSDSLSHSSESSAVGIRSQSVKRVSTESNGLGADSAKPSGLRLPSPKIGFFDGARSGSQNPNGKAEASSGLPRPGAPSGLPRPRGVVVKGKAAKLENAKVETPTRSSIQQQGLNSKSKSPLSIQEPLPKVTSVLKNAKRSPSISPRMQSSKTSPGSSVEKNPKAVKVTPKDEKRTGDAFPLDENLGVESNDNVATSEYNNKQTNPTKEGGDVGGVTSFPESSHGETVKGYLEEELTKELETCGKADYVHTENEGVVEPTNLIMTEGSKESLLASAQVE
ncbi:hypothetical protein LINGRAHAP2_LOCUS14188 [Linum grandiflorum]